MHERICLWIEHDGKVYEGIIYPRGTGWGGAPQFFRVVINSLWIGDMRYTDAGWRIDQNRPQDLVERIGEYIMLWYE